MAPSKNTFWRIAGLSYLQFLNVSTQAVRIALKEPAKSRALARQHIFYNKTLGEVKTPVKTFV